MTIDERKSLCYQIPALKISGIMIVELFIFFNERSDGGLKENGVNAEFINSSIGSDEIS